ncbi:hypothetical protein LP420_09280 [Massilia sp. B-10]|nr:hypothetical protein LP420_09280 [Massilia sp. B-10]
MTTQHISLLAYPGCMGMEVFGLSDTLLLANRVAQAMEPGMPPLFTVGVISLAGGEIAASAWSAARHAARAASAARPAGGARHGPGRPRRLPRAAGTSGARSGVHRPRLRARQPGGRRVRGRLPAGRGLLDGRRATTSWMFAAELAQRFPQAKVDPAALLQDDGGVATTGSFSAAFDLALHLIGATASARVRRAVARMALLGDRSSQAAWVDARLLPRPTASFGGSVARWLELRLADPYDLAALAKRFPCQRAHTAAPLQGGDGAVAAGAPAAGAHRQGQAAARIGPAQRGAGDRGGRVWRRGHLRRAVQAPCGADAGRVPAPIPDGPRPIVLA